MIEKNELDVELEVEIEEEDCAKLVAEEIVENSTTTPKKKRLNSEKIEGEGQLNDELIDSEHTQVDKSLTYRSSDPKSVPKKMIEEANKQKEDARRMREEARNSIQQIRREVSEQKKKFKQKNIPEE